MVNITTSPSISLDFVKGLDDNSFELFFNTTDFAIESMNDMLVADTNDEWLRGLSIEQIGSLFQYFESLLDIYVYFEYFEECKSLEYIISKLENSIK